MSLYPTPAPCPSILHLLHVPLSYTGFVFLFLAPAFLSCLGIFHLLLRAWSVLYVYIISGIRHLQKIADTSALKSIGTKPLGRHHPGCRDHTYDTDDYWICYIRHNSMTVYHPTSTCKMGSPDDPTTVVDSKLRYITVFGESIHANFPAFFLPFSLIKLMILVFSGYSR